MSSVTWRSQRYRVMVLNTVAVFAQESQRSRAWTRPHPTEDIEVKMGRSIELANGIRVTRGTLCVDTRALVGQMRMCGLRAASWPSSMSGTRMSNPRCDRAGARDTTAQVGGGKRARCSGGAARRARRAKSDARVMSSKCV